MRLLIFEMGRGGHRPIYVRRMLGGTAGLELTPVLAIPDAGDDPAWSAVRRDADTRGAEVRPLPPLAGSAAQRTRQKLTAFRGALAATRPDAVWVPSGDGLCQFLALDPRGLPHRPAHGIVAAFHRGRFAYPGGWAARLTRGMQARLLARCPADPLLFVDPLVAEAMARSGLVPDRRVTVLPDPVPREPEVARVEARARLGLPTDGRWLGFAGAIDQRKGADQLLDAFADADLASDDRLLLAGRHHPAIRDRIRDHPRRDRVVSLDRFLSEEELHLALAALDLVCLPYDRHVGLASILLRAVAADRPVLGCDYGYIGWMINRFGLGETCPVSDPAAWARRLPGALDRLAGRSLIGEPAVDRLLAYHRVESFQACWRRTLPREVIATNADPENTDAPASTWAELLASTDTG